MVRFLKIHVSVSMCNIVNGGDGFDATFTDEI